MRQRLAVSAFLAASRCSTGGTSQAGGGLALLCLLGALRLRRVA